MKSEAFDFRIPNESIGCDTLHGALRLSVGAMMSVSKASRFECLDQTIHVLSDLKEAKAHESRF